MEFTTQVGEIALHLASPVIGVRWLDAQAYLLWLRSRTDLPWRLPSELEWEMAAEGVMVAVFLGVNM